MLPPMIVFMVAGMARVHENVDQRAQQQNQVRQNGEEISKVLPNFSGIFLPQESHFLPFRNVEKRDKEIAPGEECSFS